MGTIDLPKLQDGQTSYAGIPAAIFVVRYKLKLRMIKI
jgi:hypothetical protein